MSRNQTIQVFKSWEEFYNSMLESANNLTKSYDAITTHPKMPGQGENYYRDKYFTNFKKIVKEKKKVRFRRIVTVTTKSKYQWIENSINEYKNCNNFNLAYFEQFDDNFPLIGIIIFDKKEVYLTTVFHSQSDSIYIKITNKKIINFFHDYFDKLWTFNASKKIKEGNEIYHDIIEALRIKVGINLNFLSSKKDNYKFAVENLNEHKNKFYRIGVFQFDLNNYFIEKQNLFFPKEKELKKKINFVEKILLNEQEIDIIVLPELLINQSSIERLQTFADKYSVCIIGGSYYNDERKNITPIIFPKGKIYYVEKQNIPPIEAPIIKNKGPVKGEYNSIIINSKFGSFGVLICADFYDTISQLELARYNLDFIFVISLNRQSYEFLKIIDSKLTNGLREGKKMPFYIYCNSISENSNGQSSILGLVHKNTISKLIKNKIKPDNSLPYHLAQINNEGVLIAKLKINTAVKGINTINDENVISDIKLINYE